MVGSRHLRGTVLSRVANLLRSGAFAHSRKPLWFPVVEAFPPLDRTKMNRIGRRGKRRDLIYYEDEFRTKFYKSFQINETLYLWKEDHFSQCDRFVSNCVKLVEEGMDSEIAFLETAKAAGLNIINDSEPEYTEEKLAPQNKDEERPTVKEGDSYNYSN